MMPGLVELAQSSESRTFYLKMQSDFQRYLADASIGDGYKPKVEEAKRLYEMTIREAE